MAKAKNTAGRLNSKYLCENERPTQHKRWEVEASTKTPTGLHVCRDCDRELEAA